VRQIVLVLASLILFLAPALPAAAEAPSASPYNGSPFYLPWPAGRTYRVLQGNNSVASTHYGIDAWAWDFWMPVGTLLLAPRDSIVSMTKSDSNTGGFNFNYGLLANYLVINHMDGTQSIFFHLMYNGVLVQPGQRVVRGQPVAYSGDTGFAGGPHLHYAVEEYGTYNRETPSVPAAFADVAWWDGVPLTGRWYTSGNAQTAPAEPRPVVLSERLANNFNTTRGNPFASRQDFPVPHGHFYKQGNGQGEQARLGFLVADDGNIPLNLVYDQMGGPAAAGYPVSQRFEFAGRPTQVFQKLVLQYHDEDRSIQALNIFDLLHDQGLDDALAKKQIPPPELTDADTGLTWQQVVDRHMGFLDDAPAFQTAYRSVPDAMTRYGLPVTHPTREGNVIVVRFQRAVLQLWLDETPWSHIGDMTVVNGGDIAKELGLFPTQALTPDPQPIP